MAETADGLLAAYVGLTGLAGPLGRALVGLRRRLGKEHPLRWRERLGISAASRPAGPAVWVHAASVGESVAVLPLVARLAAAGVTVVLTTVTTTSAAMLSGRLAPGVIHQFVPIDAAPFVDRFLARWDPQLAVFVESEVWPVAVQRLAARRVPLVVSNGRMSDRSFRGWRRFPAVARSIFGRVPLCLAQTDEDAARFRALGSPRVETVGNIKFDAPVPEAARPVAAALTAALSGRPVWLAASTHPGEDRILLDAHERLAERIPGLLLVIAPRHPERGVELMNMAVARRLDVCQRAAGALPGRDAAVYIADTVGELGTFYRLAPVAFVGGSLVPHGGHNPIEPARLGAAVVTGPHVRNFEAIYADLFAAGGATLVADEAELAEAVGHLVLAAAARERQAEAAGIVVARHTGALDRTWTVLEPLLAPLLVAARLDRDGAAP